MWIIDILHFGTKKKGIKDNKNGFKKEKWIRNNIALRPKVGSNLKKNYSSTSLLNRWYFSDRDLLTQHPGLFVVYTGQRPESSCISSVLSQIDYHRIQSLFSLKKSKYNLSEGQPLGGQLTLGIQNISRYFTMIYRMLQKLILSFAQGIFPFSVPI